MELVLRNTKESRWKITKMFAGVMHFITSGQTLILHFYIKALYGEYRSNYINKHLVRLIRDGKTSV